MSLYEIYARHSFGVKVAEIEAETQAKALEIAMADPKIEKKTAVALDFPNDPNAAPSGHSHLEAFKKS